MTPLLIMIFYFLTRSIHAETNENAIKAKNGIVMNPSQLIYSVLHGTPLAHGLISANPGTFCSKLWLLVPDGRRAMDRLSELFSQ
ncbi:Uncharacterised protein [Macrococcoides caseolyticum]|nr:Uncharacterised protein [Macrococcus caseolyticus]VUC64751.1 Uncharacterised protein [Macrococcus caseolyticus]